MRTMFIVIGPSGAGKSSVLSKALKQRPDIKLAISHTTRAIRPSEQQGREYHFISKFKFLCMILFGRFVEWAQHPLGSPNARLYGTTKRELRTSGHVVLEIDLQGAWNLNEKFNHTPHVILIHAPIDVLEQRIRTRKDNMPEHELRARLERARIELEEGAAIADHLIDNSGLQERSVAQLVAIFDEYAPRKVA